MKTRAAVALMIAGMGAGYGSEAPVLAPPGARPPDRASVVDRPPTVRAEPSAGRTSCPSGWTDFQHSLLGLRVCVPTNYWVRLRGGVMFTVEKQESPATLAFFVPFRPRTAARATEMAESFARFVAESDPHFRAEMAGQPAADRAISRFTGQAGAQPVEGRYCTLVVAGGTMAYVVGIQAPRGRFETELPTLRAIAQGFEFAPTLSRWVPYASPAGGFTLTLPAGWLVESSDGRNGKDNIDWVASDPREPLSRVFQWCPRYCSPALLQDPLHALRGYQAAEFQKPEDVVRASLSQISQDVELLKLSVNQPLTEVGRQLNQQVSQLLSSLGAAQTDVRVYDCLARARVDGRPVVVAFVAGIQSLLIPGGFAGPLTDLSVTLRGWCAAPHRFVLDTPVLEKVCSSMQLTPAFLRRIAQGNEQAAGKIRETYDFMNRVDDQIRQSRWDTMDAIAEMNYDHLRQTGGYVNEQTGRIEQIAPEKVVKNSHGEYVSREEVERGVAPDQATVLREAHSADYMRGVYGRIEF